MPFKPYEQLTRLEKYELDKALEGDLIGHLYKGVPTGVTLASFGSAATFAFLYTQQNKTLLIPWLMTFYATSIVLIGLNYVYLKNTEKYSNQFWKMAISIPLVFFTILWSICLFFLPEPILLRYILLAVLFMVAACFSMATVGNFVLNTVCVLVVMLPVATLFFINEDFNQKLGGMFVIIYILFLLGMNRKSTEWLINSLKLSRILVSVSHNATHDPLTDLFNQRVLNKSIETFIETAPKESFAVVCFSANRLEKVNVSLGYQAGDLIVQSLAKRLSSLVNTLNENNSKIKRLLTLPRSDAFIILISPGHLVDLDQEIHQLLKVLEIPFILGKREATLTASVGVSIYPNDGDNYKTLLKNVYAAMFQAKQLSGTQISYYKKEINERAPYLLELENDLHHALARNELVLYYQPIINLKTKKICGMEALIRWQHPEKGMIMPLDFIHIADESGLIIPIGKWVLEKACTESLQWHQDEFKDLQLKVSVNLTSKQLHEEDFLNMLEDILKKTKLHAELLDLELTEVEMLDEKLAPVIKKINQSGISISIDDFGTGYSGLNYLKFFEVNKIKIDQSFIRDLTTNNDSATIVSAILAMAKELNIQSLAEGLETEDQLNFLLEKSCDYAQGYYFSKPLPAEEFTQFLRKHLNGISL